jgi:predicted phage terminase large subunit-like protein
MMNIRNIDIERTFCLSGMLNFTRYVFRKKTGNKFIIGEHHRIICDALDKVVKGDIKRLIINIAPRYGKTELAVKNFIAYGLALNPKSKFIHLSYSDDLVLDSSKEINTIVRSDYFQRLFPESVTDSTNAKKWNTNVGGGLYAVSSAGQVTGFGAGQIDDPDDKDDKEINDFMPGWDTKFAGAIIIDDPIKPEDALSDTIRERVNNRFETTIRNRVNSRNTPIIIIMQRLHEHDLCGYLQEIEPEDWTVISLPCIQHDENGQEKALWEFKHTLEELHKIESANSFVFDTQYMQNPTPIEGLMYREFQTYDTIPYYKDSEKKNYTDTADTGSDYLCSICYVDTPIGNFVTDVLYTQKPMEYTEPKTAEMITRNATDWVDVESNNGGRGFARNVEKQCREMGNTKTFINWFCQTDNKQVRIFTKSADVNNMTFFPVGWERKWPEFHNAIAKHRKEGSNSHDDAPDALTGCFEKRKIRVKKQYSKEDLGIF